MPNFILYFLLLPFLLVADETQVKAERIAFWHAKSYLEAGEGTKAEEIFNDLLVKEKESWKKALLFYDSATSALLMNGDEKAIDLYSQIPLGENPPPFFIRALKGNMAIARWHLVQASLKKIEEGTASFPDTFLKAGDLLRLIFKDINAAQKAECAMQTDRCVLHPLLEEVRLAAQQRLSWLLLKLQAMRMESMTVEEGVPLLLTGIEELDNTLDTLFDNKGQPVVILAQSKRIGNAATTWIPLWELLKNKLNTSEGYEKAFSAFNLAATSAGAGDIAKARKNLHDARAYLEEVYLGLIAKNPLLESLRRLLSRYDNIRETMSIQQAPIESLLRQQTLVLQKIETDKNKAIAENSNKQLEESIAAAYVGNAEGANFFLNVARHGILRLFWELEPVQGPFSHHLLARTVEEQRNALVLMRIMNRMDELPLNGRDIIANAQSAVLKSTDAFYKAALIQQKEEFEHSNDYCQYHPWNEAFPLFFEGEEAAKEAQQMIKKVGLRQGEDVKLLQDNALNKFNQAVQELKKPKSNESCKENQQPEEGKEQKTSIDEVLRLLQKMEQDDRQQKRQKARPSSGGGTKPW